MRQGAPDRVAVSARYMQDVMHEVGLDEWVNQQGGIVCCRLFVQ